MFQLYLKTVVITIVLLAASACIYFFGFYYLENIKLKQVNRILTQGDFKQIQLALAKTPQEKWPSLVKRFSSLADKPVSLVEAKQLNLSSKQTKQLQAGKIIYTTGQSLQFLDYGLFEMTAYQRIPDAQFLLAMKYGVTMHATITTLMHLMVGLINAKLVGLTPAQQTQAIKQLSVEYDIPMQLVSNLPSDISSQLQQDDMTYKIPSGSNHISMVYYRLPAIHKILALGPIDYSDLSLGIIEAQYYFFSVFFVLAIVVVIMLTWFFGRNVHKIYHLTRKYGAGQFKSLASFSHLSLLRGVYDNIVVMGNNLNQLITSQKNMTRFVAHEIRTPLYTMQLTCDALTSMRHLPDEMKEHIASLKEDINAMNELMSQFLLYFQSSQQTLPMNRIKQDAHAWLAKLIERHKIAPVAVTFKAKPEVSIMLTFDAKLLAHAIDNLVLNALKFANSCVNITLSQIRKEVVITVEDDGPGIPIADRDKVFEPFAILSDSTTLGEHIGLGLSITKSIVESHKGSIHISDSPKLHGARFIIVLPS